MVVGKLPKSIVDREEFILRKCKDKRVLHVGCADFPYAEETIARGEWLHGKLTEVASECYGIDNSEEELAILRDKYSIGNIFHADAEQLEDLNLGKFDVVMAGNVISCMSNPGLFMQSAHKVLNPGGILLITVGNAFAARRLVGLIMGSEHTFIYTMFYYSHQSLQTLANFSGYEVEEKHSYRLKFCRPIKSYLFEALVSLISPNAVEGLIHVWRPTTEVT